MIWIVIISWAEWPSRTPRVEETRSRVLFVIGRFLLADTLNKRVYTFGPRGVDGDRWLGGMAITDSTCGGGLDHVFCLSLEDFFIGRYPLEIQKKKYMP